jgi:hypothetical protein
MTDVITKLEEAYQMKPELFSWNLGKDNLCLYKLLTCSTQIILLSDIGDFDTINATIEHFAGITSNVLVPSHLSSSVGCAVLALDASGRIKESDWS